MGPTAGLLRARANPLGAVANPVRRVVHQSGGSTAGGPGAVAGRLECLREVLPRLGRERLPAGAVLARHLWLLSVSSTPISVDAVPVNEPDTIRCPSPGLLKPAVLDGKFG